ncbi:MAG: hypothetical protein WCK59_01130 [Candidatus Falkowbacteria bacterium]
MKNIKEKKRRSDIIFGIILASTLGVLLTLFSNLYYDVVITKIVKPNEVDWNHIFIWFFILLATWGFISFFVYDYENEFKMNISFWKRFTDYFFNSFRPMRILRFLAGVYLMIFSVLLIFVSAVIIFSILEKINIILAIVAMLGWLIWMLILAYRKIFKTK